METDEKEFLQGLLKNRKLRSRFIRDLEIQSILSRTPEDLGRRYHGEEILPIGHHSYLQNSTASASW